MKPNRTFLLIAISFLALAIVLVLQVNWIFRTAEIKKELFNEKANMVLTRTVEALYADKDFKNNSTGSGATQKIDSLLRRYMKFYNFYMDYRFEVRRSAATHQQKIFNLPPPQPECYQKSLEDVAGNSGAELKLIFPGKEEFILAEMGLPFISSVLLILVVLVLFWRAIVLLMKEKRIAEHTNDFLNNMTHQFKTPLTNIALAGKMMIKDTAAKQEDKIKHYSGIILEENEKLRLQVEQVLSMTALERGEIPLQKTEVDVHQLIKEAIRHIRIQVESRQGNMQAELDAASFVVTGDKTHLINALSNLVDNAIKYSGERPEISIRTHNEGKDLVVVVSDKGIGIEKEYHDKVFDKYFRVPTGDVHNVKGFGLGLAYTKKIIVLHGGTIELQSAKGKGTTFTIKLPYA